MTDSNTSLTGFGSISVRVNPGPSISDFQVRLVRSSLLLDYKSDLVQPKRFDLMSHVNASLFSGGIALRSLYLLDVEAFLIDDNSLLYQFKYSLVASTDREIDLTDLQPSRFAQGFLVAAVMI